MKNNPKKVLDGIIALSLGLVTTFVVYTISLYLLVKFITIFLSGGLLVLLPALGALFISIAIAIVSGIVVTVKAWKWLVVNHRKLGVAYWIFLILGLIIIGYVFYMFFIADNPERVKSRARNTQNPDECLLLSKNYDDWVEGCYAQAIDMLPSVDSCKNIEHPSYKNICYLNFAQKNNDPAICALIDDKSIQEGNCRLCETQDECYFRLSSQTTNYQICSSIVSRDYRNRCLEEFAKYHNEPNSCMLIDLEHLQERCLGLFDTN